MSIMLMMQLTFRHSERLLFLSLLLLNKIRKYLSLKVLESTDCYIIVNEQVIDNIISRLQFQAKIVKDLANVLNICVHRYDISVQRRSHDVVGIRGF
jgi:hypothetical protein